MNEEIGEIDTTQVVRGLLQRIREETAIEEANEMARTNALALLLVSQDNYTITVSRESYEATFGENAPFDGYVLHGHWADNYESFSIHLCRKDAPYCAFTD